MVFKHNKRPFTDDEPYQFAYKHSRQVDCGSQLATFVEISQFRSISEKPPISDKKGEEILNQSQGEEKFGGDSMTELLDKAKRDFESKRAVVVSDVHFSNASGNTSNLSWVISSTDEDASSLDCGRHPSSNDETDRLACNHSRQVDCGSKMASSVEVLPFNDIPVKSSTPDGEGDKVLNQSWGDENLSCYTINKLSVAANKVLENKSVVFSDPTVNTPISLSSLSRVTSGTSEYDVRSELPVRISFSPRFNENDHRTSLLIQPQDIYSSFFDYLPRRLVAVGLGPDHQVDVSVWSPHGVRGSSGKSDPSDAFYPVTDEDNSEKWMGTCVIPMPDADAAARDDAGVGHKTDCSCPDEGSIRCVRQHVMEAREKLKKTLGQDRFVELGFCDMGEDVAKRWSEEEEQVFHEVVFANPASLGKNFWEHLPRVFPTRSCKDLVSYYFNVFMLRKRAEQNRADQSNVDSDNDEWQDSDDGEFVMEDYEEDSVVESPTVHKDIHNNDDSHVEDEVGDADDDCTISGQENEEGLYDLSEGCINNKYVQMVQPEGKNLQDGVEDHDVQDNSCTSYEGQQHRADSNSGPTDIAATEDSVDEDHSKLHRNYRNVGVSSLTDPCDPKAWDISYFPRPEKGIDFLPTCNVIEEVFGKGAWDNDAIDGQRIN